MAQQRRAGEGGRSPADYSIDGRGFELGWASRAHRSSFGASGPLSLAHLDTWDKRSHLKPQSPVWNDERGVTGPGLFSIHKTSSPGSDCELSLRSSPGGRRWQSLSRLAPEGAPRSLSPSPGAELRAALAESGVRRAELVQRLREAQERLDSQTDLLRVRDTQLEHSQTSSQLLELRHKQLADAVSALEQEKETAELCRFEESRRRGELQDKVLQLELDVLKMRSTVERKTFAPPPVPLALSPLSRTLPTTKEDFCKQGRQQVERELKEARKALRDAQESLQSVEEERDQALQQFRSAKEGELRALTRVEEANRRLSSSTRAQGELQDQLSEARSQSGQASLERDLLSSKVQRVEDNLEDVKVKLSGAVADRDRIVQEKAELHQRVQTLELQLERAQRGREGFTDQMCGLHEELVRAQARVNRQDQEKAQTNEELLNLKQANGTMLTELGEARRRLEAGSEQLHELEADKVIQTNRIVALETERSQLIGEKEELMGEAERSGQAEVAELRESCRELRESQNALLLEKQELQNRCQELEAEIQGREEERGRTEAAMGQEAEELRRVGSHWKERWQEVAVALRSTREELEDTGRRDSVETSQLKQEATQLGRELEELRREVRSGREQTQAVLQQKADAEAELSRVKGQGGALVKVELDACRQQLDLEKSRSRALLRQLSNNPVREGRRGSLDQEPPRGRDCVSERVGGGVRSPDIPAAETQERSTETDFSIPAWDHVESLQRSSSQQDLIQALRAELHELKVNKSGAIKASLQEVDGELGQVRAELQKVWDTLRARDSELEEQQQELQSAHTQVSRHSSEVRRLEQQLTEREEELEKKERALRSLERSRDADRTKTQITISSLEMKLAELGGQAAEETERTGSAGRCGGSGPAAPQADSLRAELDETKRRNAQLQLERDKVVQTLKRLQQQGKTERRPPENRKEIRPDNMNHDKQRKLVTEQLKSLFKEREQLGRAYDRSAGAQRGSRSPQEWAAKSEVVKNAMDTLANQKRREQELQQERNRQQGAKERIVPDGQQGAPDNPELQGLQEQMARLKEELCTKTDKMSTMNVEISNLRERNENLLTDKLRFQQQIQGLGGTAPSGGERESVPGVPRLFDSSMEGNDKLQPFSHIKDGTYMARQVEVRGAEEKEGDEEEEVRVAGQGEAGRESLQDSWISRDSLSTPARPNAPSTSLFRAHSADTLSLPVPSATGSPDLSPVFPRSWAGSQESLLSPRPYRSQPSRGLRPFQESYSRATASPASEPEQSGQ